MKTKIRWCASFGAAVALALGCGGSSGDGTTGGDPSDPRVVVGDAQEIFGGTVSVWARSADDGSVEAVGLTLPLAAVENAPTLEGVAHAGGGHHGHGSAHGDEHGSGDGPAGAVVVLAMPDLVREQTLFDHLELHWNPMGHEPDGIYGAPHYDFHFYTVPESDVRAVDCASSVQPDAERVPPRYVVPAGCVLEMGQHAFDPTSPEYAVDGKFTQTFLIGFWGGELTFLEPMITKEYLVGRPDFAVDIPVPAAFGRPTTYPTRFTATYDAGSDSYEMLFTDFVPVE